MEVTKEFKRDKRSPIPANVNISRLMRGNKSRNTRPEVMLRRALWRAGTKGYRLHGSLPGTPDIIFNKQKLAIFVNGCFWHRCPVCCWHTPKTHTTYWAKKFERTQQRDSLKQLALKELGWQVEVVWECEIRKNSSDVVSRIKMHLAERNNRNF